MPDLVSTLHHTHPLACAFVAQVRQECADFLRRKVTDAESLGIIAGLLERKAERVIELNLLLRYRDVEKEAKSANG